MHQIDEVRGPIPAFGFRHAVEAHAVFDVLLHVQPVERRVGLEDHAAIAARTQNLVAVKRQSAAGRVLEAGHHAQNGRLATAGGTEQHAKLVVEHVEGHVDHGLYGGLGPDAKLLGHLPDGKLGVIIRIHRKRAHASLESVPILNANTAGRSTTDSAPRDGAPPRQRPPPRGRELVADRSPTGRSPPGAGRSEASSRCRRPDRPFSSSDQT